jgi:hypothetical protein
MLAVNIEFSNFVHTTVYFAVCVLIYSFISGMHELIVDLHISVSHDGDKKLKHVTDTVRPLGSNLCKE